MDKSLNGHIASGNIILEAVWYSGTDALLEGEAVCYDIDNGTAASQQGKRHNVVTRPTTSNAGAFAGVAVRNYSAVDVTGAGSKGIGQLVEIAVPGSRGVNVALGANVTIGQKVCFTAGSGTAGGRFVRDGVVQGRGTAAIRQTVAAGVVTSSAADGMSLATDGVTLTHSSATVLVGDTLVILSGSNDGDNKEIQVGRYTVASVTSDTVCVLATTPAKATLTAAGVVHGFIIRGNPKAQADLLTGPESGGVEFICPPNAGGATQSMVGGLTVIHGGVTCAAAATATLADGVSLGDRKAVIGAGTLTTNGWVLTVTNGIQGFLNDSPKTALASITIDAAAEFSILQWEGVEWNLLCSTGATLA